MQTSRVQRVCSVLKRSLPRTAIVVASQATSCELPNKDQKKTAWISTVADRYNVLLASKPRVTQVVSSVLVGGLGDVLLQSVHSLRGTGHIHIDLHRLAVFCAVAGLYFAPVVGSWFALLNRLPLKDNSVQKAFWMTLIDQTIGAVAVNAGFFIVFELVQTISNPHSVSLLSLKAALATGCESARRNMWRTLVGNWCCWPLLNFINFLFVPPQLRLLFSNVAAVFWNMFISSVANG